MNLVGIVSDSTQVISSAETTLSPSESDTIVLNIRDGSASVEIYKQADQSVYLKFLSEDYTRMHGFITSADPAANIRFTQIVLPNGLMDGPFGQDINYDLPVKGDYLLLLHENQMAGDPWAGNFRVNITLSRE